jgi:hypothetical protein
MSLTVACLFVKGEYPYTVEYVRRLHGMVSRWIDRPFRFVCLTDQPHEMPGCVEPIPIAKLPGCFAYWTKLELFNPARGFSGRMLYLDLDTLIVSPIGPMLDAVSSVPFALTADPFKPGMRGIDPHGRAIVRRFNSSVMAWNGGEQSHLYSNWTPAVANRLSGDQDWIGEQCPDAFGMPRAWFPRLSEVVRPPFDQDVKIILTKFPKNHVVAKEQPWFEPYWGAA